MTVQRYIELVGIPTVGITVAPDQSAQAGPPRMLHPVGFQPGHSLGKPEPRLQRRILSDALELLVTQAQPGHIVARDYQ